MMDIKTAIKTVNQAAGKNSRTLSKELKISEAAYSKFLSADFTQVKRLIKICELCGCNLVITDKNNINIILSEK